MQSGKNPEGVLWTNKSTSKSIALNKGALKKQFKNARMELRQILMDAIDAKDSEKFFEFAKALEFRKTATPIDRYRSRILTWKCILDKQDEKATIREVAQIICWHDMKSDDGFSQLRRLCRELNFPLKPSRRGRKSLIVGRCSLA
jgi:hypothetical protein